MLDETYQKTCWKRRTREHVGKDLPRRTKKKLEKTYQDVPRTNWKKRTKTYQDVPRNKLEKTYKNKTPVVRPGVHYNLFFNDFGRLKNAYV